MDVSDAAKRGKDLFSGYLITPVYNSGRGANWATTARGSTFGKRLAMDDMVATHSGPQLGPCPVKVSLLFIIDTQFVGYPSSEKGRGGVHVEGKGGRRTMTS